MYKFCKKLALFGVLLLIIGCILGVISASLGVRTEYFNISFPFNSRDDYKTSVSTTYTAIAEAHVVEDLTSPVAVEGDTLIVSDSNTSFKNIILNLDIGNCYIESSDIFQIISDNVDLSCFDYSYDDDTLEISYKPKINNIFSDIYITLPEKLYEKFIINSDVGNCVINGIQTESMEANIDVGNLELNNVNINNESYFDIDAGNAEFFNCTLNNPTFIVDVGLITAYDLDLTGDTEIYVELGSIDLQVINHYRSEYLITSQANGGSVNISGDVDKNIENIYSINIVVDLGNCEINFN